MLKRLLRHKTFWVMAITLAGLGLSLLVRVVLIPRRFGFSGTADALTAALAVVLLVDTVLREGAKFSLVPVFVTGRKEMTDTAYRGFTNGILTLLLGIGVAVSLLLACFAPWVASGLLSKSDVDIQRATTLLRVSAPLVIFGCGSTVLGAFLNSHQRFKTVALRNALPAGAATLSFLLLWDTQNLETWVALAYTAGFMAYFGWLCFGAYRTGHRYKWTRISKETLHGLKDAVTLPTLGFGVRQLINRLFIEVYLVSQLGNGAITLYRSAFQIFSAFQTLIGISIATTGLPDMASHDARHDKGALGRALNRNARAAVLIGFPVAVGLFIFHEKISWMLYGRGDIDQASIELIGQLLFWLSTGLVFSCLIPPLNAGLYAQKAYGAVFANMVTMAVLNCLLVYGLMGTWQLIGVAVSVSITAVLAVISLTYLLRRTGVSWL